MATKITTTTTAMIMPVTEDFFCSSFYSRKVGFTYHYRYYFPAGTKGRLITPSSCLPPLAVIISSVSNAMISICGVLYSSFMTPCCILVRSFKLFFIFTPLLILAINTIIVSLPYNACNHKKNKAVQGISRFHNISFLMQKMPDSQVCLTF